MTAAPFVFEPLESRGPVVSAGGPGPAERAAQLLAQAQERAEAIQEEARAAGYADGHAAALAAAEAELAPARAALEAAAAQIERARDELVGATELRAAELGIALADKIVGAALGADPTLVVELVSGALRRVVERDRLVVEVHPDDVEIVRAWAGEELGATIEIRAERRIARGGCVLHTAEGEIDARVDEQLERAREVLRETLVKQHRP